MIGHSALHAEEIDSVKLALSLFDKATLTIHCGELPGSKPIMEILPLPPSSSTIRRAAILPLSRLSVATNVTLCWNPSWFVRAETQNEAPQRANPYGSQS